MSITKAQHKAIEGGVFDLLGDDANKYEPFKFDDLTSTIIQLGAMYAGMIRQYADQADAASSGKLLDSITPTQLEFYGNIYTIGVEAKEYLNFVDKGVNGWAKPRGSVYSFRTKGVDPNGAMVKSVSEYLANEGSSARNIKQGVSARESKGMSADVRNAVTAAYMIKRQGIEPKRFMDKATSEMQLVIKNELGAALRIDIINNF